MQVQLNVKTVEKQLKREYEGTITVAIPERGLTREFAFHVTGPFEDVGRLLVCKGGQHVVEITGRESQEELNAAGPLLPLFNEAVLTGVIAALGPREHRDTAFKTAYEYAHLKKGLEGILGGGLGVQYGSETSLTCEVGDRSAQEAICAVLT